MTDSSRITQVAESSAACSVINGGQGTGRCLLAISDFEFDLFLRDEHFRRLKETVPNLQYAKTSDLSGNGWEEVLESYQPEILISAWSTPGFDAGFPIENHSLKYVCSLTGSVRNQIPRKLIERGLLVSNWGGIVAKTVAESALMLTLMALRRTSHWHHVMHNERGWPTSNSNAGQFSLFGRSIGLHGFGHVAKAFTEMTRMFNVTVRTYCPAVSDDVLKKYKVERVHSLEELFSSHDIIIEMAALTPQTRGSIGEKLLRMMPDGSVFINVGRGAVVDETALAKVAAEGKIRIGLDVFSKEPLATDSPLRDIPEAILLPHQSGPTEDTMLQLGKYALQNIERYLRGEKPFSTINVETYDLIS